MKNVFFPIILYKLPVDYIILYLKRHRKKNSVGGGCFMWKKLINKNKNNVVIKVEKISKLP